MFETQPKVSVIVPVYNVEKYLNRCINSILNQTFKDFELILVNDGSTDNSTMICQKFASKDKRVKVINKSNEGVSSARNEGLRIALGEWIYFCDADDELFSDCLEFLLNKVTDNIEFVMAGYEIVKCSVRTLVGINIPDCIISPMDAIRLLFDRIDKRYHGYTFTKLFKGEIIKKIGIKFDKKIFYNEDRLFICLYLSKINGFVSYSSHPVYKYYFNESGAMNNIYSQSYFRFETDLDAFIQMYEISKHINNKKISQLIKKGMFNSYKKNQRLIRQFSLSINIDLARINRKLDANIKHKERVYFEIYYQLSYIYRNIKTLFRASYL